MASKRLSPWSVGPVAVLVAAGIAALALLRPVAEHGQMAAPAAQASIRAETSPAAASVEVAAPDPPAELAGLSPASQDRPQLASSSVFLFSSFSPLAEPPPPGPAFSQDVPVEPDSSGQPVGTPRRATDQGGFRQIVRDGVSSRDPSIARVAIRPPPRPAFRELELQPASANLGLVELRPDDAQPAWSEPAVSTAAASWPWSGDRASPPERSLQSGLASWYGPGFHGRRTASGEPFNQNALTAAHRHLPFGTKVRVVDQKTGRSVVVRINDRGPYSHGRVIDLSKASAAALGMGGLAQVRIVSAE